MDVDAIPLGVNFVKVLEQEVAKCDVLLAIIGPGWLDARDEDGGRRLDNHHDFVRIEIMAALKRDIPVIPILVDGTPVPKAHQLPDDIKDLALRNGLDVRNASFRNDMEKLIGSLRGRRLRKALLIGGGAVGAVALAVLAWMFLPAPEEPPTPAAAISAETLSREPPAFSLHTGQKVLVDDGSCPAGQIKQVTGGNGSAGQQRERKCIDVVAQTLAGTGPSPASQPSGSVLSAPQASASTAATPLLPERERALKTGDTFTEVR